MSVTARHTRERGARTKVLRSIRFNADTICNLLVAYYDRVRENATVWLHVRIRQQDSDVSAGIGTLQWSDDCRVSSRPPRRVGRGAEPFGEPGPCAGGGASGPCRVAATVGETAGG